MDTIYNYLLEKGFSKEAAAGIMGNIDVETGGSYNYQQKQKVVVKDMDYFNLIL